MTTKITISYTHGKFGQDVKPLTKEAFERLIGSDEVRCLMSQIEQEPDQEQKNRYKEQLPAVLYACQMPEDGKRPHKETALPSGLCMHDWDHLKESPTVFYMANIAGRERELGILLVHVTPRGEGLRLVSVLRTNESIEQCQRRLASAFGMQEFADPKVKDITRLSFLPSKDYILYIDDARLFNLEMEVKPESTAQLTESIEADSTEAEVECAETQSVALADATRDDALSDTSDSPMRRVALEQATAGTPTMAECMSYEGLRYSTIIDALLGCIASDGQVKEGERNEDLYRLTRELRHLCDYNFDTLYLLEKPYFKDLPDSEVRRTISSALGTAGRGLTPMLKGVLNRLRNTGDDRFDESERKWAPLPKLAPVEEMILSKFPKRLRAQVYLASLPIWGVYATHVRFDYVDGRENSLSFQTAVVGQSGSGKSFANHLYEQMTPRLQQRDDEERRKGDEYLREYNKKGEKGDKPDDPRPKVRLYSDDITSSQLLDYLDNNAGEHGLQFTEEVSRLLKSRRSRWGDNDDLYCKAYDNAIGGKESKSKQTRNIRIKIFLNTLFCGTPGAMHEFYCNPEGGLNNRIIFDFIPTDTYRDMPHYEPFTAEERQAFDRICDCLERMGTDGRKLQLPWLDKAQKALKKKWDREDRENPNRVWYNLGKRPLLTAYRAAVLEWLLRDCPTDRKQLNEIVRLFRWVADRVHANLYKFSGADYEKIDEENNRYEQKYSVVSKNKKLFSLLPDEFTTQDVVRVRAQNGESGNVNMVTKRWVDDGMSMRIGKGRFRKLKGCSASA